MKKVEYRCNLCLEIKDPKHFRCVYWHSGVIPQRYVIVKDLNIADKHICTACIAMIQEYSIQEEPNS